MRTLQLMNGSPLDDPIYVTTTGLTITVGTRKVAEGTSGFYMSKDISDYIIRFETDVPLYTNSNHTQKIDREMPLPEFLGSRINPENKLEASGSKSSRLYIADEDTPRTNLTVIILNEDGVTVAEGESQLVWD